MTSAWLNADWPAPPWVRTCVTTRQAGRQAGRQGGGQSGSSQGRWAGFNLGDHVGDDPQHVAANRAELERALGCRPAWLVQTHGTDVVRADPHSTPEADAAWTDQPGVACTIMTADCLPVLFCDRAGTRVAAAHAGWRGLLDGVLENTIKALAVPPADVLVWMGPAIGPQAFEVGPEVRDAFVAADPSASVAFTPSSREGHYLADIFLLARQRLSACGVSTISGGGLCTVADAAQFYSYRRDGQTGRMASLIWLDPH